MYKYELHMHSSDGSACGSAPLCEMIKRYKEIGYAGAVITDHFLHGNSALSLRGFEWSEYIKRYAAAYYDNKELAAKLDFDLFFGLEERYAPGREFLLYGIEPQFLLAHPELENATAKQWADTAHTVGGFFSYAHPFRDRNYIPKPLIQPDISFADAVEAYNFCNKPEENVSAEEYYGGKIKFISGSDLHSTNFDSAFGIVLKERVHTNSALAAVLHSGNYEVIK